MLTQAVLREYLKYDPLTGVFTWLKRPANAVQVGDQAGSIGSGGRYLQLSLFSTCYKNHRLAWFYMKGEWPPDKVDHIDGNTLNNSWCNLRLASQMQNCHNRRLAINNTSGVKGVHFNASSGTWLARVTYAGVRYYIGSFAEKHLAEEAIELKRAELHKEFANDGK